MKKFSTLLKIVLIVFCLFLNVWNARTEEGNKRIAVLPFENLMTEDKSINFLSSGISSEISTKLGAVPEITLIERMQLKKALEEQSFQLAGYVDPKTAVNIGKTLGANTVIVGEFQKMANKLKITARFVDVETSEIIKGKTAEVAGNYDDVFTLENEIAFSIVKTLGVTKDAAQETLVKKEIETKVTTTSVSAFEWFSKGEEALTSYHYDKAIEYYSKAIETDANYADAYFGRGDAYSGKSLEATSKAIQSGSWDPDKINPNVKSLDDMAINDFTKTIELEPDNVAAYNFRAQFYLEENLYTEAINDLTRVIKLNPMNDCDIYIACDLLSAYINRGFCYSKTGSYDQAVDDVTRAMKLRPDSTGEMHLILGDAYYGKGSKEQAIEAFKKAADLEKAASGISGSASDKLKKLFGIDY